MISEVEQECPICTSVPPGKIFQCKEGHILCESCLIKLRAYAENDNKLPKCPSCAGNLDETAICRNRALENMLDTLMISCHHASDGCQEKLKRSEIKDHEASCIYGAQLSICALFGVKDCTFKLCAGNASSFRTHLESHLNTSKIYKNYCPSTLNIKLSIALAQAAPESAKYFRSNLLMQIGNDSQDIFLITLKTTSDCVSFWCVDLCLGEPSTEKLQLIFSIPNEKAALTTWSFVVNRGIDSWKSLDDTSTIPRGDFELGIHTLLRHCDEDGNVRISVRIKPFCGPNVLMN